MSVGNDIVVAPVRHNYPLTQGAFFIIALMLTVRNFLVDLVCCCLGTRVTHTCCSVRYFCHDFTNKEEPMSVEKRLAELGSRGRLFRVKQQNSVDTVCSGNLLFFGGKISFPSGDRQSTGKVERDVTAERAYQHARSGAVMLLAVMKTVLGDSDKLKQIVKDVGMVNAVPDLSTLE
jgi:hypothetical protein